MFVHDSSHAIHPKTGNCHSWDYAWALWLHGFDLPSASRPTAKSYESLGQPPRCDSNDAGQVQQCTVVIDMRPVTRKVILHMPDRLSHPCCKLRGLAVAWSKLWTAWPCIRVRVRLQTLSSWFKLIVSAHQLTSPATFRRRRRLPLRRSHDSLAVIVHHRATGRLRCAERHHSIKSQQSYNAGVGGMTK